MKRAAAAFVLAGFALAAPATSRAEPAHSPPQGPAKIAFGPGFQQAYASLHLSCVEAACPSRYPDHLVDHEWGFAMGGFGGIAPRAPLHHVPVIFVHGNVVDACDWYPVRDDFLAAGWTMQEMYALSYNGLGSNSGTATMRMNDACIREHQQEGWDGEVRVTNDDGNVPDLYDFIRTVQAYTGSARFTIVSHSLGVTLARKTLKVHPELRKDLVAFVGIAGGNDGTSLCPPGSEGYVVSCNEIAKGTPWLAALNGPALSDETYAPAQWLTVCDGSGVGDPAYAGPPYAHSPFLKGALNLTFPHTYHNDLRVDAPIIAVYRAFIEGAERPYLRAASSGPAAAPARVLGVHRAATSLPGTGVGVPLGLALVLLLAAVSLAGILAVTGRRR